MKILQVSPFDFDVRGGVNEHVIQLDYQFREMGHETRILAPASATLGEGDDGHIYRLGKALPIPSNGSTARIGLSPFVVAKVREFLEREKFDIVHCHEPLAPMLPLASLLYSRSLNVGTFHAARRFNFWYHYTKAFLDFFIERLDVRVAVSPSAREFADMHFPGDYRIVPNGINLDRFNTKVEPIAEYMDGRKNILFVGRYDESRKGFIYLLRALPLIRRQFPKARLIVVGDGNAERQLRILEEQGMRDVLFVGVVRERDLPRYYVTGDVFVAPSTGRESFGIILLEALASGIPVVASDIPGYAGVIKHGETGMLATPRDPYDLAMAIVRVLADSELRQSLISTGNEHVKQFSWPNVARQLLGIYREGIAAGLSDREPVPATDMIFGRLNG